MVLSPFAVGTARVRFGRWQGSTERAHLVPITRAPTLTAANLAAVRDHLRAQGFSEVFTAAVGPGERDMLVAAGFTDHEWLHLLWRDLADIATRRCHRSGIRRGRRRDFDGLLAVDAETFDEFWRLGRDGLRESIRATPVGRLRVVGNSGEIVGYCVTGIGGSQSYLQRLAVASKRQGEGLGTALVTDAFGWARRRNATMMWVNTQETNDAALRFYQRLGFNAATQRLTVLHRFL